MAEWIFTATPRGVSPKMTLWRQAVRARAPYSCVDTLEFTEKSFDFGNQLGVMAAMNILTENIGNCHWPVDWWQAVKNRWFPNWALKKWPVKWTSANIFVLYPNASLPDEQKIWKISEAH